MKFEANCFVHSVSLPLFTCDKYQVVHETTFVKYQLKITIKTSRNDQKCLLLPKLIFSPDLYFSYHVSSAPPTTMFVLSEGEKLVK